MLSNSHLSDPGSTSNPVQDECATPPPKRRYTTLSNRRPPTRKTRTSTTYERLEDLLTEAGYKETRVFTPEIERRSGQSVLPLASLHNQDLPDPSNGVRKTKGATFWSNLLPKRGQSAFEALWTTLSHETRQTNAESSRCPSPSPSSAVTASPTPTPSRGRSRRKEQIAKQVSRSSLNLAKHRKTAGSSGLVLRHSHSTPNVPKARRARRATSRELNTLGRPSSTASNAPFIRLSRSSTAVSQVTTTQVMCRSAPASRSNSRVRGRERPPPPTLAQTESMDDPWTASGGNEHVSPFFGGTSSAIDLAPASPTSEEEEEEEVGLDAILIPPKRQRSIRSLRKHLLRSTECTERGRSEWEALGLDWNHKVSSRQAKIGG